MSACRTDQPWSFHHSNTEHFDLRHLPQDASAFSIPYLFPVFNLTWLEFMLCLYPCQSSWSFTAIAGETFFLTILNSGCNSAHSSFSPAHAYQFSGSCSGPFPRMKRPISNSTFQEFKNVLVFLLLSFVSSENTPAILLNSNHLSWLHQRKC